MSAYTPSPAPAQAPKKQLSGWWFALPAGLFALALLGAVFFVLGLAGFLDMDKQYIISAEPGEPAVGTVTVETAGSYQLYHEYRGGQGLWQTPVFYFFNTATGETAASRPAGFSASYQMNGLSGQLVAVVDLTPGTWNAVCDALAENGKLVFVLTPGFHTGRLVFGIGALVACAFAFIGAIISLVVVLVVRGERRRQLVQQPPYQPPPAYAAPGGIYPAPPVYLATAPTAPAPAAPAAPPRAPGAYVPPPAPEQPEPSGGNP